MTGLEVKLGIRGFDSSPGRHLYLTQKERPNLALQ
jgi:hypothetical protein